MALEIAPSRVTLAVLLVVVLVCGYAVYLGQPSPRRDYPPQRDERAARQLHREQVLAGYRGRARDFTDRLAAKRVMAHRALADPTTFNSREFEFRGEHLCPEAESIKARETTDEFERRSRTLDLEAAIRDCGTRLHSVSDDLPDLMVLREAAERVRDYDFDKGVFPISVPLRKIGGGTTVVGPEECKITVAFSDFYGADGLSWTGGSFGIGGDATLEGQVPVSEGPDFKQRFLEGNGVRVEILFEPDGVARVAECHREGRPGHCSPRSKGQLWVRATA